MKLAHVAPTQVLELVMTHEDNYHLAKVDQILEDIRYADFYRSKISPNAHVMLDTKSEIEYPDRTYFDSIHRAINDIYPNEIILFSFHDLSFTYTLAQDLGRYGIPYMIVPTGDSEKAILESTKRLMKMRHVNSIGLLRNENRDLLVPVLKKKYPGIGIHFLGALSDFQDILASELDMINEVRGMSTSRIIRWSGQNKLVDITNITQQNVIYKTGYFKQKFEIDQLTTCRANMDYWTRMFKSTKGN